MQVILLETIANLGELGEEVKVKGGYARNFLVPHGKAVFATDDAKDKVEAARRELAAKEAERIEGARMRMEAATKTVQIGRLVIDETGKLFGSVTNGDIAEAMRTDSVEIARAEVSMPEGAIKQTGAHKVEVILHPEVRFDVDVTIFEEGRAESYAESQPEPEPEFDSETSDDEASEGDAAEATESADDAPAGDEAPAES